MSPNATVETPVNEKFYELLNGFEIAMLVTRDNNGRLRARPMALAGVKDGTVWFLSGLESGKTDEIEQHDQVLVTCQRDKGRYISLSGKATLSRDRAKIAELWKETYKVWFPGGQTDPNLALIAVIAEEGEYWDNEGFQGLHYMLEATRAYLSGTTPQVREGEQHAKVQL